MTPVPDAAVGDPQVPRSGILGALDRPAAAFLHCYQKVDRSPASPGTMAEGGPGEEHGSRSVFHWRTEQRGALDGALKLGTGLGLLPSPDTTSTSPHPPQTQRQHPVNHKQHHLTSPTALFTSHREAAQKLLTPTLHIPGRGADSHTPRAAGSAPDLSSVWLPDELS